MRADLALWAEFDDVRIAGGCHNPPYGLLFAVVKSLGFEETQVESLAIDLAEPKTNRSRDRVLFYIPDKTIVRRDRGRLFDDQAGFVVVIEVRPEVVIKCLHLPEGEILVP